MGKESCIEHPKGLPFIVIKQSYVTLFSGDHSYAAILYCFEYFTNNEIDRLERIGSDEKPWITAPISIIVSQTTGLFSERSIKPRLMALRRLGIVTVDRGHRGSTHRYLLDCEILNALLKARHVFSKKELDEAELPECKFAPEDLESGAATGAATGADLHLDEPLLNLKVLTTRTQNSESSLNPSVDSDERIEPETMIRVWNGTRGLKHLGPGDRRRVVEHGPLQISERDLSLALSAFALWAKTAQFVRSVVGLFLKDPCRWIPAFAEYPADDPAPEAAAPIGSTPQSPTREPDPIAPATPQRDFVAEWNAAVPACPDQDWHPPGNFKAVSSEPAFQEKFAKVCEMAQRIHMARGTEVGWLSLRWLFKSKDGMLNWRKVIGDLAWMAAEGSNGAPKKVDSTTAFARAIANQKKKVEQERQRESNEKD